jgi:hypothetical protein
LALSSSVSASLSASLAAAGGYTTDLSSSFSSSLYTLSSSVSSSIAAEAQARTDEDLTFLKLDGSRSMQGSLNLGSYDLTNAGSGSFAGDVNIQGSLQVNGALTYVNTTNLQVTDKLVTIAKGSTNGAAADGAGIEVDGAGVSFTYDNAEGKWVSDIGLKVAGEVKFESALKLSGSQFTSISTPVVDSKFDVSDAIHALDQKIYDRTVSINNFYNERRLVITGTLSSGTQTINLTANSANIFAGSQMDYIALDIMVDTDGSGYTNDLVAVKMYVFGAGTLMVSIDAPASPTAKFRLIAVNEKNSDTIP